MKRARLIHTRGVIVLYWEKFFSVQSPKDGNVLYIRRLGAVRLKNMAEAELVQTRFVDQEEQQQNSSLQKVQVIATAAQQLANHVLISFYYAEEHLLVILIDIY
jgi:hypothetical protein